MNDAIDLLKRYGRERDEDAFREVVARFFGLVHGVALRRLNGDAAAALDVTQIVFADLAKKAGQMPADTLLGGWLHTHTCFVVSKYIRSETRRAAREKEAAEMNLENAGEPWRSMSPVLDEALQELSPPDRSAILLRYFEGQDLRTVGAALRVSEDAAQKRVERALERLKPLLEARGVSVSVAAVAAALSANAAVSAHGAAIQAVARSAISSHGAAKSLVHSVNAKIAAAVAVLMLLFVGGVVIHRYGGTPSTNENGAAEPVVNATAAAVAPPSETTTASANIAATLNENAAPSQIEAVVAGDALRVHVLNKADGKPIAGATVRVSTASSARPLGRIGDGDVGLNTDANGVVRIPISSPPPSKLLVEAWANGFAGWVTIWEPRKGEIIPQEHTMSLEPGVMIGGRVVDEAGRPVEGAAVRLYRFWSGNDRMDRSNNREQINSVTNLTDAAGAWSANHAPERLLGNIGIRISAAGYADVSAHIDPPKLPELRARTWTVALNAGTTITGRVTDTNGQPIVNAQVAYGQKYSGHRKETSTDATGRYELRNLTVDQDYEPSKIVSVLASGYASTNQRFTNSSRAIELNFVLQAGSVIRGRVVNAAGEPIKRVRVSRENNSSLHDDGIDWSAETDAEGRFAWDSAPATPQSFYFGAGEGYAQIRGRKLAPGPEEHIITMIKRGSLRGVVKNAKTDAPLPEFFVMPASGTVEQLSSWSESSERKFNNGAFEIGLDEVEHTVVRIRAPGFFTANFAIPTEGQELKAELKPSRMIEGVVLNHAGRPVAGAQVAALSSEHSVYVSIGDGRFTRGQLQADNSVAGADGRFSFSLSADAEAVVAVDPGAGYAEMNISADEQPMELRLQPWGRVEGTLVAENMPLAGVRVSVDLRGQTSLHFNGSDRPTDQGGRFTFEKVPPREVGITRLISVGVATWQSGERTNIVVAPGAVTYVELHVEKNPKPPRGITGR
jgi:RNA polymerase sigma factor (sigma-70 family)